MSFQWAKPAPDATDGVMPFLGPDRVDQYEPEGQLKAAGARIAYGSDCLVDPLDEFFAVEVAVLREGDWGPRSRIRGQARRRPRPHASTRRSAL